LEGIHLLPGLVDLHADSDSLVVHVVLTVEDRHEHLDRFAARAEASARPAGRYDRGLDAIRDLQGHLVAAARGAGIPVVENKRLDSTVRRVLDVIFKAIDEIVSPRSPEPAPG
jgi:2-phosphoglycerate kinase